MSCDPTQIEVSDIAIDSRLVTKNSAFFALQGKTQNGSKFITDAIKNGAAIIVLSKHEARSTKHESIICENPFTLLTEFLKIFYTPLPQNIYAITGTNGKTSTAEFTRQILQFLEKKSASIGTLGVMCDEDVKNDLQNSSLTTPDIASLYKNLHILKKHDIDDVALEVSSIGLEQGRIAGLKIAVGAFTNFTQDHLDYHQSIAEYFRCKMILFNSVLENSGFAVLNSDIPEFKKIKKICEENNHPIIDYGFKANAIKLLIVLNGKIKFLFNKKTYEFELVASGEFQAFNTLCALGNVLAKHQIPEEKLYDLVKKLHLLQPAPGRMQQVSTLPNGAQIFIDFAHSPDALENVLKLARDLAKDRVVVLFGCGGNRDATKRPVMGAIASRLTDLVIITDDNPRLENPATIRAEILAACDRSKTIEINDRKSAIEKATSLLQACDILILAGKGHEKYQIIGDQKFEFDEELIVKNALTKLSQSQV
ncbi:MAG: hypothetical protein A2887_01170 [Alphaproteobacteria bacterium RIFCSPLOWO2_01_FULL_40_26]|nr:MAG: hypothetical protein A3D15_05420 [Alphaproteobacteria bacterium RIFCSPHIGHO2_02_FULL_40_34]OFW88584.1 MAG: hypothetical protein A2794_00255 [Alphaproteobacteria bacterium RIFCSPHIGHO2_01_FULL_40_8]OFW94042.1 MAG: hypothetical protein A2887_01170 [Alphaproteobacteria bacterium RIFCSPLOWO2_01_FULL_40_26]OFX09576.1 MAG: hypothetical protein A3H30_05655 [Alphaproteobacteria bacterium RIFCSPLOWO2_02_FULL_40_19]OFX11005.1 MAG: hypothetical protein A3G22_00215 [Alphaproteobacteria bacterium RI